MVNCLVCCSTLVRLFAMHSNTFWLIKLMLNFSLSYLQLENRVLPPIGATSRATIRGSFNGIREPLASIAATNIKTFDNEMTSNTASAQHYTDSSGAMVNSTRDLRAKSDNNESYANTCNEERGDNSSSNTAINLNIATKNNRTNSCPKLPTLSTDSKATTTSNCK